MIVDDADDKKPEDWVDQAKIPDPKATKVRVLFHVQIINLNVIHCSPTIGMRMHHTKSPTKMQRSLKDGSTMNRTPSLTLVSKKKLRLQVPHILIFISSDAEKPEEWDDEEDGDWIAPSVMNPKCEDAPGCGEWKRYV